MGLTKLQLSRSVALLLAVILLGTLGYALLGSASHLNWSFLDCLYQTVITITGVGFGEILDLTHHTLGRPFTLLLVLFGMLAHIYFISTLTAFIVEGHLTQIVEQRRMQRTLANLKHHFILCGAGETGLHVLRELAATGNPTVVIDEDPERLRRALDLAPAAYLQGDASDPRLLQEAGVERAQALAAVLPKDSDNVLLTLTARQLNPRLRIVAKALDPRVQDKLRLVGADAIVAPTYIGGLRLASELIRPTVVSFLDRMLRDPEQTIRIFEVPIPPASHLVNCSLANSQIYASTGLLVLAIERSGSFIYNPTASTLLQAGDVLIALGTLQQCQLLQQHVARSA